MRRLKTVLREGMTIRYEYDFGSTTELEIRVTHYRKGPMRREPLTLLSRNDPTEYICSVCKKEPAVYIDTERMYDEDPFLCKKCSKKYDGEMLLKVCNSPRMGVCAYEGSDRYPDQFIPDTELSDGKT